MVWSGMGYHWGEVDKSNFFAVISFFLSLWEEHVGDDEAPLVRYLVMFITHHDNTRAAGETKIIQEKSPWECAGLEAKAKMWLRSDRRFLFRGKETLTAAQLSSLGQDSVTFRDQSFPIPLPGLSSMGAKPRRGSSEPRSGSPEAPRRHSSVTQSRRATLRNTPARRFSGPAKEITKQRERRRRTCVPAMTAEHLAAALAGLSDHDTDENDDEESADSGEEEEMYGQEEEMDGQEASAEHDSELEAMLAAAGLSGAIEDDDSESFDEGDEVMAEGGPQAEEAGVGGSTTEASAEEAGGSSEEDEQASDGSDGEAEMEEAHGCGSLSDGEILRRYNDLSIPPEGGEIFPFDLVNADALRSIAEHGVPLSIYQREGYIQLRLVRVRDSLRVFQMRDVTGHGECVRLSVTELRPLMAYDANPLALGVSADVDRAVQHREASLVRRGIAAMTVAQQCGPRTVMDMADVLTADPLNVELVVPWRSRVAEVERRECVRRFGKKNFGYECADFLIVPVEAKLEVGAVAFDLDDE